MARLPRTRDPRVDAYIAAAAPFARPILRRVRATVHRACPLAVETIKWGAPSFEHHGIVCRMAAFRAHCAVVLPKAPLLRTNGGVLEVRDRTAMGHLGRLRAVGDLPPAATLTALLRQAVRLNEEGRAAARRPRSTAARGRAKRRV
jgi:hypothetical protein